MGFLPCFELFTAALLCCPDASGRLLVVRARMCCDPKPWPTSRRLAGHPEVTDYIKSYVAAPLIASNDCWLGVLCACACTTLVCDVSTLNHRV